MIQFECKLYNMLKLLSIIAETIMADTLFGSVFCENQDTDKFMSLEKTWISRTTSNQYILINLI